VTILRSGSASHVGRVRSVNEDKALEGVTLFAVADGMGGHAGGDVAAQTAIAALEQRFGAQPSPNGLVQAVRDANVAVWERSNSDPDVRGMGTTLAAIGLVNTGEGDHLIVANVGDSRAYRLRHGSLEQMTVDHSVAEELVARGELTQAEADVHPHRHILTRALGVAPDVEVDVWQVAPEEGDRLVLCSDGLTNELPDARIREILSANPDPQEAADALVERANASGGNDNITVVVVDVLVAEERSPDDAAGAGAAAAGADRAQDAGTSPGMAGASAVGAVVAGAPRAEASSLQGNGARGPATVASATVPAGLLGAPPARAPAPGVSGRVRRRDRPKRPRRVTFRVLLFILLVAALGVGAWMLVRWYANASYYVGLRYSPELHTQEVVIYRGRPGGVLGIKPKVAVRTGITLDQVPQAALLVVPNVKASNGVEEPSLQAAKNYVHGLKCQANLVAPSTALPFPDEANCPTTNAPPATTTVPGSTTRPGATTPTTRALGGRLPAQWPARAA
jgi:PPM family protein phosphatase